MQTELLNAAQWCHDFFETMDVDGSGSVGKAELSILSAAFGESIPAALDRCDSILSFADSSTSEPGMIDEETYVSYWLQETEHLQTVDGAYSIGYVSMLRTVLSGLEERMFEASRFLDAPDYAPPHRTGDSEEAFTASAIMLQSAFRGRSVRKTCAETRREDAEAEAAAAAVPNAFAARAHDLPFVEDIAERAAAMSMQDGAAKVPLPDVFTPEPPETGGKGDFSRKFAP